MFRGLRKILGICTLKDYLSKDENGITYLECLLKDGKSLDVFQEEKISKSIEAGYIYTKYNKRLYFFEYSEKQLFTVINGEYFIEYLLSNDNYTIDMIKKIENHIEIVDILIKYGKHELLWINPEIVNKLLVKDNNNNYLIEKYINDDSIMDLLIRDCHNEKILLEICEKYNKYELLKCCSEEVLMTKTNDNEILIDYLLNKHIIPDKLKHIPNNIEFINFLINKGLFEYFKSCEEESLLNVINNDKTLLEILIEKNVFDKFDFCITSSYIIKLLHDLDRLDLIDKVSVNLLKEKTKKIIGKDGNNKTLLEYLLDKGYKPKFNTYYCREKKDKKIILSILCKREEFELIYKSMDKDSLFFKFDNGDLLIDKLLEKDINILLISDIIINKLFNIYKGNETYLDCILEKIKNKKIKYNLNNINLSLCDLDVISNFYLALAKHDMMYYIEELSVNDLLKKYNDKMLLEELIDKDVFHTVNKILNKNTKTDIRIVTVLKSKGIKLDNVDIPIINKNITCDYLYENQRKYGIGPIQHEGDYLLNELSSLFLNDGKSDKELINALISGYRQALNTNYSVFLDEIKMLIKIKKNHPKFYFFKVEDGAYFRRITGSVYGDCSSVDTMLHETGHACYYYRTNSKYPDNFEEVLYKTRNNKNIINKVAFFSNEYLKILDEVKTRVELKYVELYSDYYTKEKINEIEKFLEKEKIKVNEDLNKFNISSSIINSVLEQYFTKENYIYNEKEKFIKQLKNAIIDEEYSCISSISDIIDGIFEGDLYSKNLFDENNKLIKGISGHGISYYSCNIELIFSEMIAEFSVISKSNDSYQMLKLLKDIIGDDLFDLLEEFYYNDIIGIEKNKKYKKNK